MPAKLKILWYHAAVEQLNRRDRYTYSDIRRQISDDPRRGAIEFDRERHDFVSPVIANTKYSVVWRLHEAENEARVIAVLPLKLKSNASPEEIKKQVMKAVKKESGGRSFYPG